MASGRSRTARGSFLGTGAVYEVEKVGFKPQKVELINVDDAAHATHIEGMGDASMLKQKAGTTTLETTNGITLTDSGFTIGADADLNVADERTFYVCHE